MKVFQQQKQQQVRLLKDLQDSNHFNTLSDDAKLMFAVVFVAKISGAGID